jgi:asparagine synthase (glutamine-hydrolysing)
MCGINGGWTAKPPAPADIESSLNAMRHRGPDDLGYYRQDSVFIGNRRLSIIDLTGGHQPIFNEDRSVAVVCNGEIYNYVELARSLRARGHTFATNSDTEVIVHLYEEYGSDLVQHLRGMFALAIWDARRNVLFGARDRFGKKPLYYTQPSTGGLLFASELKSLRSLAESFGERWSINEQAVYDYLSLCVIPQPSTIYRRVFSLPAASLFTFNGEQLNIERYWDLTYSSKTSLSYDECLQRTRELVADAVRLRLRSDVPLGVFLSAGIDSSVVAYEASGMVGDSLQTFTVSVDDKTLDEAPVAARTARALGVHNTVLHLNVTPLDELERVVSHFDQPYADSSAIPSMKIAALARQHVTVVLNGDGGDELFAGYRRYIAARLIGKLNMLPRWASLALMRLTYPWAPYRRSKLGLIARFLRAYNSSNGERYLAMLTDALHEADKRQVWKGENFRPTEDWITSRLPKGLSQVDTQMCADVYINLVSDLLIKMDMATMGASIEGRSPFMDHVLAEFAASLPDDYRLAGWRTKALLRDAYQGVLPEEVTQGPKRGFEIPLNAWLKHDLRPVLMDTLGSRTAMCRAYLDESFIDDLIEGKTMQDRNWAYILYSLLVLELWLREFAACTN